MGCYHCRTCSQNITVQYDNTRKQHFQQHSHQLHSCTWFILYVFHWRNLCPFQHNGKMCIKNQAKTLCIIHCSTLTRKRIFCMHLAINSTLFRTYCPRSITPFRPHLYTHNDTDIPKYRHIKVDKTNTNNTWQPLHQYLVFARIHNNTQRNKHSIFPLSDSNFRSVAFSLLNMLIYHKWNKKNNRNLTYIIDKCKATKFIETDEGDTSF